MAARVLAAAAGIAWLALLSQPALAAAVDAQRGEQS